jgi:hypothetical protein
MNLLATIRGLTLLPIINPFNKMRYLSRSAYATAPSICGLLTRGDIASSMAQLSLGTRGGSNDSFGEKARDFWLPMRRLSI